MHNSELDGLDGQSAARQQKVSDIMQALLPGIDAHRRKKRLGLGFMMACALALIFTTGYAIGESLRPLSYSEKIIVQVLIEHTAREQKKPVALITEHLLDQLHAMKVKDIKSHQLGDALYVLGQYVE